VSRAPAIEEDVPEVPEVGRLTWMLFFEPVTLFHILAEAGVVAPGGALLALWPRAGSAARTYIRRMLLVLGVVGPLIALSLAVVVGMVAMPLPRSQVLGVLASGLLSGALWAAAGSITFGAATAFAIPLVGVVAIALLSSGTLPTHHPLLTAAVIGGAPCSASPGRWPSASP
jgi:hypothetical protein